MKIHLIHAPLDMRKFHRWAGNRGLIRNGSFDAGYAFHVLLSAMFGKGVLQPFRLFASERRANAALYAYADVDEAELRGTAAAVAPPDCLDVIEPDTMRSKPMPSRFAQGRRLGFDLRLRPVRRLHRDLADAQLGRPLSRGAEVDAFRLEVMRRFPSGWGAGVTRESVYAEWLCQRFGDAVAVEECRLVSVNRSRAVRGKNGGPEGPDAILHGTLAVANEETFAGFLRNGVGRHRAYGYGMLLLRPPNKTVPER
ncbi:MAG: type I-E CRISPR-associated protein Cas6/Cse3/CasE [Acidobacteria bacterium]|nr:type I-E CRISPR-associated protein Cas6/Cse3/CasE [Acidobacteriota bacterium]